MKRNSGVPKTMLDGVDNTAFIDRRSESEVQHDRLMRDETMEWEDDIRDAHDDEE